MSSSNDVDKFKFNGSNYPAFKEKLMDFLFLNDLEQIVLEGLPSPLSVDYQEKLKIDRKARAHIRLKVTDAVLLEIKSATTSKEMVDLLDKLYDRKNSVSLGMLEEKYNSRKIKDNEKLEDFLKDLTLMRNEINGYSQVPTIKPQRHVLRNLNGLAPNESYKSVISAIYTEASKLGDEINVDDVATRLIDECKLFKIDAKKEKPQVSGTSMKLSDAFKRNSKGRSEKGHYVCWCCGSEDSKHECKKRRCFICGKLGCKPESCPDKFDKKGGSQTSDKRITMMAIGHAKFSAVDCAFYLDSACSHHISSDLSLLFDYVDLESPELLETSKKGVFIQLVGKGTLRYEQDGTLVEIHDVFYSPDSNANLFSNSVFDDKKARTVIESGRITLTTSNGQVFMQGRRYGPLYLMDITPITNLTPLKSAYKSSKTVRFSSVDKVSDGKCFRSATLKELHWKLGHANPQRVKDVARLAKIDLKGPAVFDCVDCLKGKITRDSFKGKSYDTNRPLELVHSDVGFVDVKTFEGHSCFSIFVDDYTKFVVAFVMSSKGQASDCFLKYATIAYAKFGTKIAALRVDDGKEYKGKEILDFCSANGTIIESSDGYTPELNGTSERTMRTLTEMVRANLISSGLSKELWDEALFYSVHTLNLLPFRGSILTPYEKWSGRSPHFDKLHRFGALAIKHVPKEIRKKLDDKGVECIFVGYDKTGYRLFMPETNRIAFSRHCKILDNVLATTHLKDLPLREEFAPGRQPKFSLESVLDDATDSSFEQEINWDVQESLNHFIVPSADDYLTPSSLSLSSEEGTVTFSDSQPSLPSGSKSDSQPLQPSRIPVAARPRNLRNVPRVNYSMLSSSSVKIPANYEEAMASPFREEWKRAMQEELTSLENKGTWTKVEPPANANVIKNRWVFAVKTDKDGNVIKFKARLTAKGYSQVPGRDFDETFAPVSDYTCVRLFFALVVLLNLLCDQLDINAAFLNSFMEFLCFLAQPQGFEDGTKRVLQLVKSIYGLKQGAHDWYQTIRKFLLTMNFRQFRSDPCLYVLRENDSSVFLLIWVDDILIAGNSRELLDRTKKSILSEFAGKDFGSITDATFLKWRVKREGSMLYLNQENLSREIIQKFGYDDSKPVPNPGNSSVVLGLCEGDTSSDFQYRSAIGSLFHLVNCTRPDLSFAVSYASRFQVCYGQAEVTAVKRIFQYLNGTRKLGLCYERPADFENLELVAFVDASYDRTGEKSTTGYAIYLNGNLISWKSQKQSVTSKSSAEAEYIALSTVASEIVFIHKLLEEFGLVVTVPIEVYEDNTSAIKIATNPCKKSAIKHVNNHHHFVRDYIDFGLISLRHVSSETQVADILTKNLNGPLFQRLVKEFKLRSLD
jgi:hypothetical protein